MGTAPEHGLVRRAPGRVVRAVLTVAVCVLALTDGGTGAHASGAETRASTIYPDPIDFPRLPWADVRTLALSTEGASRVAFSIETQGFTPLGNDDWVFGDTWIAWYVDTNGDSVEDYTVWFFVRVDGAPRVRVTYGSNFDDIACSGQPTADPARYSFTASVPLSCLGSPARLRSQVLFHYEDTYFDQVRDDVVPDVGWSSWLRTSDGPAASAPSLPGRPTGAGRTWGVALSWSPPASNGGSPLVGAAIQGREVPAPIPTPKTLDPASVVNGTSIPIRTAPWQVRLYIGPYLCGGSLIDEQWVLTAAHCAEGFAPHDFTVWAGIADQREMTSANGLSVDQVIIHPGWAGENSNSNENDLALVHLSEPTNAGTPVRLFANNRGPAAGTPALISGWGALRENGNTPTVLQGALIDVMAGVGERCGSYGSTFVPSLMICAGTDSAPIKDTCQGDSGGPLVVPVAGTWELAGITSFGDGCAREGSPGVYTRVSRYVPWIYAQMGYTDLRTVDCAGTTCTSARVGRLTEGTDYVFRVAVRNATARSAWSAPSGPIRAGS